MEQVGWDQFLKRPIGTGPYMVDGEVKDYRKVREGEVYATLIANADYWKRGYPKIHKISFVRYSPQNAVRALTEGRVDLVTSLVAKDTLRVEGSPHSKVVKGRDDIRMTLAWINGLSPHTFPLRNLFVRKALNYAINKEELMRYAFKGNAVETKGLLTDKAGVDLSDTKTYEWNIPKALELLKEAGYGDGFKMRLFYHQQDFLIAHLLQRFFGLLKIETEITPVHWEWFPRHIAYLNTREGYSWEDEEWWIAISMHPGMVPETMGGFLDYLFHSGAAFQTFPEWLMLPLDNLYQEALRTKDRGKRFRIYKKANEYTANQAIQLFTVATLSLYGVNEEVQFVPHVSQYLYLDYSSVTDRHWSISNKNN
jgi:peptide/nickel transport system substrate-binding protein